MTQATATATAQTEQTALEAMLEVLLEIVAAEAAEVRELPVTGPVVPFPTVL